MSAETLKFFEEKTTEEIINWMLSNLTEEQIRMCLDQSGIPDTSGIQSSPPVAAASAAAGPSPPFGTMMLPDGSIKQLQPGEGSSSAAFPVPAAAAAAASPSAPAPSATKLNAAEIFLKKYRTKCVNTQYLIKEVSKAGVLYYEFKEVEDTDDVISPGVPVGEVGWVKVLKPISQFKEYCTEEDREIFSILKEENLAIFLGAPVEVMETAADYASMGLISPIPIPAPDISEPVIAPTVVQANVPVEITEPMLKGLKIQQASSGILETSYNVLFRNGMTMYPVFIYGSDGDVVLHLTTTVLDGKLSFIRESTNKRLLNSKFRKITNNITSNMEAGMYNPSDNIQEEMNNALREVAADITSKISFIYDRIRLSGYTYFGDLADEVSINMNVKDNIEMPYYSSEMFGEAIPAESFNMNIGSKNKKATEMSIPELEQRMKIIKGPEYARDYKPEKYTNAMGIMNVRYVKRTNMDNTDLARPPVFTEFGMGSDDEDLLFD